ncbi:hypothetical protein M3Y95_00805300 [Aphelenchoides besseyi]|nr:hypothetical protein M3Y95_00805300 [Aphelenchoides besseyi]
MAGLKCKLNSNNLMPMVGLGTYGLFDQTSTNVAVDAALANGYRLFDSAKFYRNEHELGQAFEKLLPKYELTRSDIFIETKVNISGHHVKQTTTDMLEDSLSKFKTDDDDSRNRKERSVAYSVLEEYQTAKKIRSIGVSNFEARHIDQLLEDGHRMPTVNQCELHPHLARLELREYCKEKGIQFQAHTSLAKQSKSLYKNPTLQQIAETHNLTVQQTLLGFAYWQEIAVIPKSGNPDRIASNLKFLKEPLSPEEIKALNEMDKFKHYSDCDGWNVQ